MAVDTESWDGPAAMSRGAQSDDPAAFYRAICAGRKEGDPALQSSWALPHHREPGMACNADGVRNALSRLPQTEGLTNRDAAEAHLRSHLENDMASMMGRTEEDGAELVTLEAGPSDVQVRNLAKRELDVRVVPWDTAISTMQGRELFVRGAFEGTDPRKVLLMGLEHEASLGLGQDGRPVLTRHPLGKGLSLEERDDGGYMTFRVAKTQRGDELLALAAEGIVDGVSAEFREIPGGTEVETHGGRRTNVHRRVDLRAVSPTYQPAYAEARVLAVRSQEGDAPVAEEKVPAAGATTTVEKPAEEPVQLRAIDSALAAVNTGFERIGASLIERMEKLEERARSTFIIPGPEPQKPTATRGQWMEAALKILSGERIPDAQYRTIQDLVTTDNAGIVPDSFSTELIGVIDPSRPFMSSTRRLATPASGMSLVVPVIDQRPTVAEQSSEKAELSSQVTKISTKTFDMVTKGGAGDISLQLLKRADRSFLDLYLQLLAEAYAIECDSEAVAALIDAIGNVASATALDPEALALGSAYEASFDAIRRPPDTIWLSTAAISAFIDAKADGTNAPLYAGLSNFVSAGGGAQGSISGLRAVHVPALDDHGAYAIVGPSSGFAWAEDGTYTLQVDVPAKAGRDVALVGMLWFAPWYPDAFSLFNVAS